jgi:hypothetical protein
MAVYSVPARAAAQPSRVASFPCWQFIGVQVIGPQTIYIADNQADLKISSDSGNVLNDGLQINQASGLQWFWWKGELWAAGSINGAEFILMAPGSRSQVAPDEGLSPGGGGII